MYDDVFVDYLRQIQVNTSAGLADILMCFTFHQTSFISAVYISKCSHFVCEMQICTV